MTAAAAGALAIGLVLAPGQEIDGTAQLFGLLSVVFLVASTCFSTIASLVHGSNSGGKTALRWFLPWQVHPAAAEPSEAKLEPDEARLALADRVLDTLLHYLSLSIWAAGASALTLVIALSMATVFPNEDLIEIQLSAKFKPPNECPNLDRTFRAEVESSQLRSAEPLLPVRVLAKDCDNALQGHEVEILIQRTAIETLVVVG